MTHSEADEQIIVSSWQPEERLSHNQAQETKFKFL